MVMIIIMTVKTSQRIVVIMKIRYIPLESWKEKKKKNYSQARSHKVNRKEKKERNKEKMIQMQSSKV